MTKSEKNIFAMYKAVNAVLTGNATEVDKLPALKDSHTRFSNKITELGSKDTDYISKTDGKTISKTDAENELIENILPVVGGLQVFAKIIDNHELKVTTKVTVTDMKRMRDNELINKAKQIFDFANTNSAELVNYGITADTITQLNTLITNYEAALSDQGSSFAEKQAARKALTLLFDTADDILKDELDNLMELTRSNNPDFYNEYKAARVIKDLGIRHEEPVTDNPEG